VGGSDLRDEYLYAINANGTRKWRYLTSAATMGTSRSFPAIGEDGTIYVGSYDGYLYAINSSSLGPANSPWPMFHHDVKHTGRVSSSAQTLDGVWLMVKVNVKGYRVDPGSGAYAKSNGGGICYFYFVWNVNHYDIAVWSDPNGVWDKTFNATVDTNHPGENFISHLYIRFAGDVTGDYIDTYHSPFINIKNGKVTYKGTGEVIGGKADGKDYYGYFTISGTSVTQDKLPFTPTP
jgi:hypothetical protein